MTWTYTGPSASDKDQVRFYIQDTLSTDPQLSDEEINWLLLIHPQPVRAAAEACGVLAAKYSRQKEAKSIGDLSVTYADLTERYRLMKTVLMHKYAESAGVPIAYAGGVSVSDVATVDLNTNRFPGAFGAYETWHP